MKRIEMAETMLNLREIEALWNSLEFLTMDDLRHIKRMAKRTHKPHYFTVTMIQNIADMNRQNGKKRRELI